MDKTNIEVYTQQRKGVSDCKEYLNQNKKKGIRDSSKQVSTKTIYDLKHFLKTTYKIKRLSHSYQIVRKKMDIYMHD